MAELSALFSLVKNLPSESAVFLTAIFVLATLWLNSRKVNVESMTSVSKLQVENMEAILKQNKELGDTLHTVRQSQAKLHEEINQLREQNTRMYQHIIALEAIVMYYQPRCSSCPNTDSAPPPPIINTIPFKLEDDTAQAAK